ncbi:unnamed protein product [Adineta steineri]|uniref:Uncharacterized protein n=1 Tax=Adineta steineri TaxID=433720 RepID=A0A815JZJ0_9BILA|nr:unnamed protein product [Adineta steineri]
MLISSTGGLILDFTVFQPAMNGVGSNLVAVQASRLSTTLHQQDKLEVESCYLLLSFHINIKSIAASLDDLTTLGILASIGEFLFKIIGVGGNLLAVQASRLSTTFHQQGKPREIQDITQ